MLTEGLLMESNPAGALTGLCASPPPSAPLPVDAVVCRLSGTGLQRECRVSTKTELLWLSGSVTEQQDKTAVGERGADRGPAGTKCTVQRFCPRRCHFPRSYRTAESAAFTLSMFLRNGADDDCSIV